MTKLRSIFVIQFVLSLIEHMQNYEVWKKITCFQKTTLYLILIFLERSKPHFRCTLCMYFLCVTKGQQRSFCLVNTKVSIFQKDTQLVLLWKDDSWLVQYYLNIFFDAMQAANNLQVMTGFFLEVQLLIVLVKLATSALGNCFSKLCTVNAIVI